jgi:hypothetical protein
VVDATGKVDILDLLSDTPRATELVHVYRAVEGSTFMLSDSMFVCVLTSDGEYAQAAGAGGEYHHLPDVDGGALRETAAWREWVMAQPVTTA